MRCFLAQIPSPVLYFYLAFAHLQVIMIGYASPLFSWASLLSMTYLYSHLEEKNITTVSSLSSVFLQLLKTICLMQQLILPHHKKSNLCSKPKSSWLCSEIPVKSDSSKAYSFLTCSWKISWLLTCLIKDSKIVSISLSDTKGPFKPSWGTQCSIFFKKKPDPCLIFSFLKWAFHCG